MILKKELVFNEKGILLLGVTEKNNRNNRIKRRNFLTAIRVSRVQNKHPWALIVEV